MPVPHETLGGGDQSLRGTDVYMSQMRGEVRIMTLRRSR